MPITPPTPTTGPPSADPSFEPRCAGGLDPLYATEEKMEIEDDYQPYIYFIATIGFCLGFLLFLIDGYYHFKYIEFSYIGRKDLFARLGFLAHAFGFLFYPASLIFVAFLTLKSTKSQNIKTPTWPFSLLGVILVGACFYTGRLDSILFIRMQYWLVGLVLMMIAATLFWNKTILNKLR